MPWTVDDVDRFKSGRTDAQKRQWVAIANRALADCEAAHETNCDAKAIRQANGVVGKASESEVELFAVHGDGAKPSLRVFQAAAFAEPPEWSPFLPVPGLYSHPLYGDLDFSPQNYDRVIEQFKNGIYQERLPVTVEHEQYSSAVGWITDMRLAESGAIEAKVEWNKRGKTLLEDDRYGYVSAEWFESWTPPDDPTASHDNIAVGLTLCTRPYFKERSLPPLAASEAVLTRATDKEQSMAEDDPKEELKPIEEPAAEPEPQPEPVAVPEPVTPEESMADEPEVKDVEPQADVLAVTLNEATVREFNEMKRQLKLANTEKATLLAEKNALLSQRRQREFTAEVRGKSDDNDTPWIGDIEDHVKMCISLAEHYGDNSFELEQYKRTNRATAAQIKQSNLFKEIGTGKSGEGMGAEDQIQAYAKNLRQADPKLTPEGAYAKALKENPHLYAESIRG